LSIALSHEIISDNILLTNPLLHHIGFISYGKGFITLNYLTTKNNH